MEKLQIVLLGPPGVYEEGRLISIQRRVPRALLFYLAMQAGLVGRGELLPLFWPEEDDVTARRNLRDALARLRDQLPDPTLLITQQDQVRLDLSRVAVDALEFIRLANQVENTPWRIPASIPLPENLTFTLQQAAGLWRSPRFMAGANLPATPGLDDWLQTNSQRLEHIRQRIIERLADHAAAAGNPDAAILWLRQALEYDEINENLHYRLLKLLASQGLRTEIQTHWKIIKKLYLREGGGKPPMALVNLLKSLLQELPVEEPPDQTAYPVPFGIHVPLVGRDAQLHELNQAYRRGGLAVILGDAGCGKSRLIQEVYEDLQPPPRLLLAHAHELESNLPFQPLIDMLRHTLNAEDWRSLPVVYIRPLLALLPELTTLRPEVEPLYSNGQERSQVFDAFHNLLAALASKQRLLLVLDNAQWADEASLAALAYLIERSFFTGKGLLVIAARSEALPPQLASLLDLVKGSHLTLTIQLPMLKRDEIATLTRSVLGQSPPADFVTRLEQDTSGNPLFILETLRSMLDLGIGLDLAGRFSALPLPGSIHALVHNRLKQISPLARQVLGAAAILGSEFEPGVVEKTSLVDPVHTVEALEELEQNHLILPVHQGDSEAGYYLIQKKVREVVVLELGLARKRLLHRRAAQALEICLGGRSKEQAAVIAQHYESGGDPSSAFRWWIEAAQHARRLLSRAETNMAYTHAEKHLPTVESLLSDQDIYQMYTNWGESANDSGDLTLLERICTTQLRLGEQRSSPLLSGSAFSGLANAAALAGRYEEAFNWIEKALKRLSSSIEQDPGGLAEYIEALTQSGTLLTLVSRSEGAKPFYQKALELGETSADPRIQRARFNAHFHQANLLLVTGWPDLARREIEMALSEHQPDQFRPYNELRASIVLAMACSQTGQLATAQKIIETGLNLADQLQNWRLASSFYLAASFNECQSGNMDAAWQHASAALDIGNRFKYPGVISAACCRLGDIYCTLADFPAALDLYRRGLSAPEGSYESLEIQHKIGFIRGSQGELPIGLEMVEAVISTARKSGLGMIWIPAQVAAVALYRIQGEASKVIQAARQIENDCEERAYPFMRATVLWILAAFTLQQGDTPQVMQWSRRVIDAGEKIGSPWVALRGYRLVREVLRQQGQPANEPTQAIQALLDQIEPRAQTSPVRGVFQNFRKSLQKLD